MGGGPTSPGSVRGRVHGEARRSGDMAYQFECEASDCVFLIRSADEDEVVAQVQRHSEEHHGKSPPPVDVIRERMATVDVE